MSAQMVIMYNNLVIICEELDKTDKADFYHRVRRLLARRGVGANECCGYKGIRKIRL
jgi:hypothetical protein